MGRRRLGGLVHYASAGLTVALFAVIFGSVAIVELGIDVRSFGPLWQFYRWVAGIDIGLRGIELLFLVLSAGFGVVGLGSFAHGLPAFGRAVSLLGQDPVPVDELHLRDGRVAVEGVAKSMDEYGTVRSTYSGTDCLAYRFEEQEREARLSREDRWQVTESGSVRRPFAVTDETGTVVVDPRGATLSCGRDVVLNSGRMKRTEWRLEPGERVYVAGRKLDGSTGDGPGDATTYIGAGEDGSFTISDAGERWTILRFLAKGTVLSLLGLVITAVGAAFLYGLVTA